MRIWEKCLKKEQCEGKLSREFVESVSRRYKVNAGGIALSVKNAAALVAKDPQKSFEECVSTFLQAHCTLLGIQRSWEVSQVNALLAEMENFNGIFIVSTNLIQRLDPAALRRFTFRLHFDFLGYAGKDVFYRTYFGPLRAPALSPEDLRALHNIERLTPSDFRNVRQKLFYLENEGLSGREIVEALRQEAQSRDSQGCYRGLGEERHGIGFQE